MKSSNQQSYISKRIRHLRLQQGLTQEQLEEKAELPQKYAYRLERQEPNIKIATLEKIMMALDDLFHDFLSLVIVRNVDLIGL
ncbi:helix-turn-helix domain-containing protein [Streptococcus suis]